MAELDKAKQFIDSKVKDLNIHIQSMKPDEKSKINLFFHNLEQYYSIITKHGLNEIQDKIQQISELIATGRNQEVKCPFVCYNKE